MSALDKLSTKFKDSVLDQLKRHFDRPVRFNEETLLPEVYDTIEGKWRLVYDTTKRELDEAEKK